MVARAIRAEQLNVEVRPQIKNRYNRETFVLCGDLMTNPQLEDRVYSLEQQQVGYDRDIAVIGARMDDMLLRLQTIETGMERVEAAQIEHTERFDEIDKKFEVVDHRFEAVDHRFDAIDQRFEAVDRRFGAIDEKFDAMDQRFETVETQLQSLETMLRQVLAAVTDP